MGALIRRGGDHQQEALLGRRQLRDVVVRMGTANVLLHGAKAFLLLQSAFFSFSSSVEAVPESTGGAES